MSRGWPAAAVCAFAVAGGCVHVPPHAEVPGAWALKTDRRYDRQTRGELCAWEAEQLTFNGQPLWVAPVPDGEEVCRPGADYARTVDIVGQDGPFLSAVLREDDESRRLSTVQCVTWDLATLKPATLRLLDDRLAARRWAAASAKLVSDPTLTGWVLSADAFLLRDRRVVFCLTRGDEVRELPVR